MQSGTLRRFLAWARGQEEGQDMIEYALLVAFITVALIITILGLGPFIEGSFQDVANALASTPG
jgi:Flp pilus assembly pilin Flp